MRLAWPKSLIAAARPRLASDHGLGMVEVLVAALLLVIGALATMAMVSAAHRQTFRSEQSQVISDRLQLELEAVKRLDYAKIALTSSPTAATDSKSPNYRVTDYGAYSTFALNRNGTNEAELAVNGVAGLNGGVVAPGPTPFSSGDIQGSIYRYVTWINDSSCPDSLCPGAKDLKRITIALQLATTSPGGERTYQQIQSDVVDGGVEQTGAPTPTPAEAEPVRYFLSDTPCDQSAPMAPSSHAAHNTLGPCSAGVQSGATAGAPDRLFKESLPATVGEFDLSTDVTTAQPADVGLQMPVQPKNCDYAPSRSDAGLQVHRWVSAPVGTGPNFVLDGSGTLAIWSRTINDAVHSGRLCVWLFTREQTSTGGEADNLIPDRTTGKTYFEYSDATWSATSWNLYSVPLSFEEIEVKPGDRLGVAVAIDAAGTPGEALQLGYNYQGPAPASTVRDSILSIYTTTKSIAPG